MAAPTNTVATSSLIGLREDLENTIYNISPAETPFISNAGRVKVSSTKHEWLIDQLNSVDLNNAVAQGDDASMDAASQPTRVGNFTQIMDKTLVVAGTTEATDKAGRKSELAYHLAKKGRELKRDHEAILLNPQASVAPIGTATPGKLGSLPSWITTNVDRGATGANGGYNTGTGLVAAPTDGTPRAFTETILKSVMQKAWASGGEPTTLMVGAGNKVVASGFAGIAQQRHEVGNKAATIIGTADVYLSDFGKLSIVPNRFQRNRDAFFIDFEYVKLGTLRALSQWELAKTGDSEKRQMLQEVTLVVPNEAALGIAADLT